MMKTMMAHSTKANSIATRAAPRRMGPRISPCIVRSNSSGEVDFHPSTFTGPYKNIGPPHKALQLGDSSALDVLSAAIPTVLRAGTGALVYGYEFKGLVDPDTSVYGLQINGKQLKEQAPALASLPRPTLPLELYEFEGCPFCKKVREAISILDLEVIMRPCPKDGEIWRPKAIELGGKAQFPFLVDPNYSKQLYESDDIIRYLYEAYGPGSKEIPLTLTAGFLTSLTAGVGMMARVGHGNKAVKSRQPTLPLRFYGYEASPFVKLAREVLCEMQLSYLYINVARGSPRRQEMFDKYGHFQAPFLEDPNEGVALFESASIIEYLKKTYSQAI